MSRGHAAAGATGLIVAAALGALAGCGDKATVQTPLDRMGSPGPAADNTEETRGGGPVSDPGRRATADSQGGSDAGIDVPVYTYRVVDTFPHDPNAWTQGLVFTDGLLYEGTGLEGRSTVRKVDLASGEILQAIDLAPDLFGEGIAVWEDSVVQITWQDRVGFVYDKGTLERTREWSYDTEGWGLTQDGRHLIMSDGSATLYFRDPETLEVVDTVLVTEHGAPLGNLNELEYVHGEVFANVWLTDRIVIINPSTGVVRATVDFTGLLPQEDRPGTDVLNGIAHDVVNDRLFVTGKLWPKLFQVELVAPSLSLNLLPVALSRM